MEKKITLTLSGGGVRSAAAIGVIKYLEENDYEIVAISGTSGGSIIALLYSYGVSREEIEEIIRSFKFMDIFRFSLKNFFSLTAVEKKLEKIISNKEQKIPLYVCTTNVNTGEPNYHTGEKDIMLKVMASCSFYPHFKPLKIQGDLHSDGGYTDNLPNIVFKEEDVQNISVNVSNLSKKFNKKKLDTRLRRIQRQFGLKISFERADILVNVKSISDVKLFDFKSMSVCISEGYKEAEDVFSKLNKI